MKSKRTKQQIGKASRAAGVRFESKVRKDIESKGWICSKWMNNVEFSNGIMPDKMMKEITSGKLRKLLGHLIPAKHKFRGLGIPMAIGTGFPDFIAYCKSDAPAYVLTHKCLNIKEIRCDYAIIGIESKSTGYLDKLEKEKCRWLLENNIFGKILIASKGKKRGEIIYKEFGGNK